MKTIHKPFSSEHKDDNGSRISRLEFLLCDLSNDIKLINCKLFILFWWLGILSVLSIALVFIAMK